MAGNLGTAVIEFSADTAKFVGDIGRAAATFNTSMSRMEVGVANLRNAIAGLAGFAGLGLMVKGAIDAGDELNKLSQKIGVSVQNLSEFKFAASLSDLSLESFTRGMRTFNETLVQAQDGTSKQAQLLRALGIDATKGPAAALKDLATAFSQMADGETKTATAMTLLGAKVGIDFIPMLNQGGKALDENAVIARKLGLTIGPEFAMQAEQFNDNMKMLTTGAQRFGIAVASETLPGLVALTTNLAKAAESGHKLRGLLIELGKLSLAAQGEMYGGPFDTAAQLAFNATELGGSADGKRPGIQSIRRPGGAFQGPPRPNPDQVACIVSGGKWENGRCVRPSKKIADESENIARLQLQGEEEFQRQLTEAQQTAQDIQLKSYQEYEDAKKLAEKQMFDFIDQEQERAVEKTHEYLAALATDAKKAGDEAHQFGLMLVSALGNAITKGGDARDMLRGLGQDVLQLIAKLAILNPLEKNIETAFAGAGGLSGIGSSIASFFGFGGGSGGPELLNSFAVGTDYVPHDMIAQVHKGEQIIPAGQAARGGAINIYPDLRGASPEAVAALHRMVLDLRANIGPMAVGAVLDAKARGYSFA